MSLIVFTIILVATWASLQKFAVGTGFLHGSQIAATTNGSDDILARWPTEPELAPYPAALPNFAVLPAHLADFGAEVYAMSLGLDPIRVTVLTDDVSSPLAIIDVDATHGWVALKFRVDPTRLELPLIDDDGEAVELHPVIAAPSPHKGQNLYSHIFPYSSLLEAPEYEAGLTQLSDDGTELGMPGMLRGLDLNIPLYAKAGSLISSTVSYGLPPEPDFFFTVTADAAAAMAVDDEHWEGLSKKDLLRSVFHMKWQSDGDGGHEWSTPVRAFTGLDLGLDDIADANLAICGLSVDTTQHDEAGFHIGPEGVIGKVHVVYALDSRESSAPPLSDGLLHCAIGSGFTDPTHKKKRRRLAARAGSSLGPRVVKPGTRRAIGDICTADPVATQGSPTRWMRDAYVYAIPEKGVEAHTPHGFHLSGFRTESGGKLGLALVLTGPRRPAALLDLKIEWSITGAPTPRTEVVRMGPGETFPLRRTVWFAELGDRHPVHGLERFVSARFLWRLPGGGHAATPRVTLLYGAATLF